MRNSNRSFLMETTLWLLVLVLAMLIAGCSLQGQKYPVEINGKVCYDEWWSMRCMWVSSGVEAYTRTDNYTSGANINESNSDANSIAAAGSVVVKGAAGI